ncbi:MAG: hypothetical protein ACE5GJ_01200 [Gemmatimonadota bacterium]
MPATQRVSVFALAALMLAPLFALPGVAQAQEGTRRVDIFTFGGLSIPTRDLGVITVGDAVSQVQYTHKLRTAPTLGGGIMVPLPNGRSTVRLAVTYTPVQVRNIPSLCDGSYDCSAFNEGEEEARILSFSAGMTVQRKEGKDTPVRPYFLFGAALRSYRFTDTQCSAEALTCEAIGTFLSNQFRPSLQVGVGAHLGTGKVKLMVELQALFGTFQSSGPRSRGESQNDLLATVGLSVPVFSR